MNEVYLKETINLFAKKQADKLIAEGLNPTIEEIQEQVNLNWKELSEQIAKTAAIAISL